MLVSRDIRKILLGLTMGLLSLYTYFSELKSQDSYNMAV